MARPPRFPRERRSRRALQPGPGQLQFPETEPIQVSFNIGATTTPERERPSPQARQPPAGMQTPGPSIDTSDYWDWHSPTPSSAPNRWGMRHRTRQARFNQAQQLLEVQWRGGTWWTWEGVPVEVWRGFKGDFSPGKYINAVLNRNFPNHPGGGGSIVGE
jgi:hypothetical protein